MANLTAPRITAARLSNRYQKHCNITVASGITLYHGCIGGFDSASKAAAPTSGVYSIGRVVCPNGVSAGPGEKVDLEEGSFAWDLDTGESLPAIGAQVYVKTNHEVSINAGEGQPFATYEGTFTCGDGVARAFYVSGYGHRTDAT